MLKFEAKSNCEIEVEVKTEVKVDAAVEVEVEVRVEVEVEVELKTEDLAALSRLLHGGHHDVELRKCRNLDAPRASTMEDLKRSSAWNIWWVRSGLA